MESGRFTEFFKNAPFDKRSVLRGFRDFSPPFSITPVTSGESRCPVRAAAYRNECTRNPFVWGGYKKISFTMINYLCNESYEYKGNVSGKCGIKKSKINFRWYQISLDLSKNSWNYNYYRSCDYRRDRRKWSAGINSLTSLAGISLLFDTNIFVYWALDHPHFPVPGDTLFWAWYGLRLPFSGSVFRFFCKWCPPLKK